MAPNRKLPVSGGKYLLVKVVGSGAFSGLLDVPPNGLQTVRCPAVRISVRVSSLFSDVESA